MNGRREGGWADSLTNEWLGEWMDGWIGRWVDG